MEFSVGASAVEDRYRVLLGVGHALAGILHEGEIHASIYRETSRLLETDGFYIAVHDPDQDRAEVVFWVDRGQVQRGRVPFRGSASEVIARGEAMLVRDHLVDRSLLLLGDPDSHPTRSSISAPLRAGHQVIGVISVQSYRARAYETGDLELLDGIAHMASVAIQNARLVSELDRRRREAERILELARALTSSLDDREVMRRIVDAALELAGADGASVWLLQESGIRIGAAMGEPEMEEGSTFLLTASLTRRLAEDRETVIVEDVPASKLLPLELRQALEWESAILVPLGSGERVMGALAVGTAAPRSFTREDARLLQRLAGHASLALENAYLHARLRALSLTDPLTGLPNRRHLELHLSQEFAAAQRGRPLSLVLFDLNDFKRFNDAQGHLAGDEALKAAAEVLSGETRAMNLVARFGGDEFVAVLSDTSEEGGRLFAERVTDRMARHPLLGPARLTFSSGVAEFSDGMTQVAELVEAADRDLYAAKARRNGHAMGTDE